MTDGTYYVQKTPVFKVGHALVLTASAMLAVVEDMGLSFYAFGAWSALCCVQGYDMAFGLVTAACVLLWALPRTLQATGRHLIDIQARRDYEAGSGKKAPWRDPHAW